jgi:DNA-binding transcriptional LysR family regulator
MPLDARSLRNVLALASSGSYRRAAEALHLSQPALSRAVASLESELGVRLFDRGRRGVTATRFGELLVERGRSLIAGLDDIQREITLMRGLKVGELSVAAGLYPAEMSVGTAIGRLSARHPGLRIALRAAPWREVADAAAAGTVDVAVVELSPLENHARLALEPLPRHPALFVCRPGHPLLAETRLSIENVFAYPFVGPRLPPRIGATLRPATPTMKPDAGGSDLVPPLHVESIALAKRIVAAGNAIAALPRVLVAAELASGSLAALDWRPTWLHTAYGFVYRRDRMLSPAALAFIDEVRAAEAALTAADREPRQRSAKRRAGTRRAAIDSAQRRP